MYRLHRGVEGRPQGNNVSAACQLPWFCITEGRVWEKNWSVLQAEMKAITDSGSLEGKLWKNSIINHLQQGHTHMHTHNSSQTFSHLHLSKEQGFCYLASMCRASLVAHTVKNLSAMWETWVRSLSWKDPLEEGLATHSSILAWRPPWTEKSVTPTTHGVTESDTTK